MRAGQNQHEALASSETWREVEGKHPHLSPSQRAAVEQILSSRDKITGLEGVAGAGKTTSLAAVREAAEREGYYVAGLRPRRAPPKARRIGYRIRDAATASRREEQPEKSGSTSWTNRASPARNR